MDIRKALVLGGVVATALVIPAAAASASVAAFPLPLGPSHYWPPANVFTATTSMTKHADSGGQGDWATDAFTRTLTIKETGHAGSGAGTVYSYTATVSDSGTFTTITGAFTPNQGGADHDKKIKGTVQGTMRGTANYSFTATSLPTRGRNLGVPARESGPPAGDQTTSLWYEQAFPAHTAFAGPGIGTWSWTYLSGSGGCTQGNGQGNGFGNRWLGIAPSCGCGGDHRRGQGDCQGRGDKSGGQGDGRPKPPAEKWVDSSSNGDGQQPADGNITGG